MTNFAIGNIEQAAVTFREQRIAILPVGFETLEYLFKAVLNGTQLETNDLPKEWSVKAYGLLNEYPDRLILFIHSEEFPVIEEEIPVITPEMRRVYAPE